MEFVAQEQQKQLCHMIVFASICEGDLWQEWNRFYITGQEWTMAFRYVTRSSRYLNSRSLLIISSLVLLAADHAFCTVLCSNPRRDKEFNQGNLAAAPDWVSMESRADWYENLGKESSKGERTAADLIAVDGQCLFQVQKAQFFSHPRTANSLRSVRVMKPGSKKPECWILKRLNHLSSFNDFHFQDGKFQKRIYGRTTQGLNID